MDHSITIGTKNTWTDWHLIPQSRPVVNPPAVKVQSIEIPYSDSVLDLTEELIGRPLYGNRRGSFEFIMENGYRAWSDLYSEIMNYLHGKTYKVILTDDPGYCYSGRLSVNALRSAEQFSSITIDYDLAPYKMELIGSMDDWEWDTFNFMTGIIRYLKNLIVDGSLTVTLIGSKKPTPLMLISSEARTVTFNGVLYDVPKGVSVTHDILISEGEHQFIFTGNGTISIVYTGGSL